MGEAVPDQKPDGELPPPHPDDVCACGDALRQHQGGVGRCNLGELCTPARCQRFRLFRSAEAAE